MCCRQLDSLVQVLQTPHAMELLVLASPYLPDAVVMCQWLFCDAGGVEGGGGVPPALGARGAAVAGIIGGVGGDDDDDGSDKGNDAAFAAAADAALGD